MFKKAVIRNDQLKKFSNFGYKQESNFFKMYFMKKIYLQIKYNIEKCTILMCKMVSGSKSRFYPETRTFWTPFGCIFKVETRIPKPLHPHIVMDSQHDSYKKTFTGTYVFLIRTYLFLYLHFYVPVTHTAVYII